MTPSQVRVERKAVLEALHGWSGSWARNIQSKTTIASDDYRRDSDAFKGLRRGARLAQCGWSQIRGVPISFSDSTGGDVHCNDIIRCPGNRNVEVKIRRREEPLPAGQAEYVVVLEVDGRRINASAIEPYLVGYNVMSSNVTLAACPDESSNVFSGEIGYWLDYGDDATWEDRVFIRFYVRPGGVSAERVTNTPHRDHSKGLGQ